MKEKLSGYVLEKFWFNFSYHTPKIRPLHYAVFGYFCWRFNTTGWESSIEFSSETLRSTLHINSRNPLDRAISELEHYGIIKVIQKSLNQYSPWIIEWGEVVYQNIQLKEATKIHDEIMSIADPMNLEITPEAEEIEAAPEPVKKDGTEVLSYHADPEFKEKFAAFLQLRKNYKPKPKPTDKATIKILVQDLLKHSNNEKDIGIQILDYSIKGNYWDLFPPAPNGKITDDTPPDEFMPKLKPKLKIDNAT